MRSNHNDMMQCKAEQQITRGTTLLYNEAVLEQQPSSGASVKRRQTPSSGAEVWDERAERRDAMLRVPAAAAAASEPDGRRAGRAGAGGPRRREAGAFFHLGFEGRVFHPRTLLASG